MPDITMPKLSDTMEEGKILRWLVKPGESVQAGDVLVEVETDKADMEIEAEHGGVLREIKLQEGDSGAVGAVIAVVDDGDDGDGGRDEAEASGAAEASSATSEAAPESAAEPEAEEPSAEGEAGSEAAGESEEAAAEGAEPREAAGESGEAAEAAGEPEEAAEAAAEPSAEAPAKKAPAKEAPAKEGAAKETSAKEAPAKEAPAKETPDRPPTSKGASASSGGRPAGGTKVSPLARTRAAELGIDPTTLEGTGPGGRVTRKDVEEAHAKARASAPASETTGEDAPSPGEPGSGTVTVRPPPRGAEGQRAKGPVQKSSGDVQRVPLTGMRATIARRMTESKREAPHFYVTAVASMDEAVRLRRGLKASGGLAAGVTYNHLVLKACADALRAVPEMNARFAGDAIEVLPDVNVGVATAVPDGLIVPVIHHADRLTIFELATRARELGEKAKQRNFAGDDLSGATFSVSNLGMYDVESFVAVINPPQAGILAVGSVGERPVVRDGALEVGHTVHLTLSCDHRAVDGARAAEFLREVRERLENPVRLLVPREDA